MGANLAAIVVVPWVPLVVTTIRALIAYAPKTRSAVRPCGTPHVRRRRFSVAVTPVTARMGWGTAREIVVSRTEPLDAQPVNASCVSANSTHSVVRMLGTRIVPCGRQTNAPTLVDVSQSAGMTSVREPRTVKVVRQTAVRVRCWSREVVARKRKRTDASMMSVKPVFARLHPIAVTPFSTLDGTWDVQRSPKPTEP